MKKIKILRIIARLNIGGPAVHTILLSEGLDKSKFETILICGIPGKNEGDMGYYATRKGVTPYLIPQIKRSPNIFNDTQAFFKIFKLITKERPQIIHTHTAKAGFLGRSAGIFYNLLHPFQKKKIKLIHTFHGHIFDGYFNKFATWVFRSIEKLLGLFTDQVVTVSESVKDELFKKGIVQREKISVIPLGFELDEFLNLPERFHQPLNIGIIGRLVPIKNHRLFLEAAKMVSSDNPGFSLKFKIIGDGELRTELESYAKELKNSPNVEFSGWRKDISQAYDELDIVTLTSLNEGTPVSLIEAMAAAKPVVTTDAGGVRDLLGEKIYKETSSYRVLERGILVKGYSCRYFSEALSLLINDSQLCKKLGLCGREYAREHYTKDRLIRDIERLYLGIF